MITEVMMLLIVLGAAITFIAWSNSRKRNREVLDRREVEDSTGKLKQELERTAGEIIGRMENHVAHLENILDESERNRTQLEGRVAELKKLLKRSEGQSGEIRDLLARLEDAGAEVDKMQRKMDVVERKLNLAMSTPLPMQQPIQPTIQQPVQIPPMSPPIVNPMMPPIQSVPIQPTPPVTITQPPSVPLNPLGAITVPPLVRPTQPTQPIQPAPKIEQPAPKVDVPKVEAKVETEPVQDFDKILEESIADTPSVAEKVPSRPPDRNSIILSAEKKPMTVVEGDPVKIEATRKRLNEASAEMAQNPPEEFSAVVVEQQEKALKKRRPRRSTRDVRKAAVEAIKAAEEFSTIDVKPAEEPKPVDKKILPERRDLKLETTDSSIVKEMLLGGMSIEEISRETGLGRGAIELIQQLTRRQLDRR